MSSATLNDAKREEMKRLMSEAKAKGYSSSELASIFKVSSSTISSWGRGASMGTNAQREALGLLWSKPGHEGHPVSCRKRCCNAEVQS